MVAEINEMTRYTSDLTGKTILSKRVMDVMNRVPRHEFVSADMRAFAYQNHALPLASNQTISQPYIVALMTDLADVDEEDTVLEVGTGSGYQAAVLAELCRKVYSVEIIESLGEQASLILQRLGYGNVSLRIGDGYHGWPEAAPFDAILVTAAPETVPEALLEQLRSGGKLVIPLGQQGSIQTLRVFEKNEQGEIKKRDILPVGFVPLTRED
ncbi:MAG: protein-L-isoaspartate(D-aspartate) O-methyltransferase [Gammaproteobacteria bacterium]|nr:protein-L-isoaspartate(D-aspartate) O-methyltransferase [Gammaproteobacteria bacterium]